MRGRTGGEQYERRALGKGIVCKGQKVRMRLAPWSNTSSSINTAGGEGIRGSNGK